MKLINIIIILIFIGSTISSFSQDTNEDIEEHYWNGKIDYDTNNLKRHKSHENKMIFLQLKYENDNTSKEYFRINDSTYLYTDYYNSDSVFLDSYWNIGKKNEGYLEITDKLSGDTITVFDYDTFDESVYLDTLLLPTKKWKRFHKNGKLYYEGNFDNNERNGIWKFYDKYQNPTMEIEYENGVQEHIAYHNIILTNSRTKTSQAILGNWILRPAYLNGEQSKEAEIDSLNTFYKVNNIEGFGDIYSFNPNNECILTELILLIQNTKKEKED